jgi:hypothetical protein
MDANLMKNYTAYCGFHGISGLKSKVIPSSGCTEWFKACNVTRSSYHGGAFEGNECRALLKKHSLLRERAPANIQKFVTALACFDDVVRACYSHTLADDYERVIEKFRASFMSLRISVTPKVHAVFYHVSEFCTMTDKGLGPWSEQTSESIHHDFAETWKRFKIKDQDKTVYATNLLKSVQVYNSQHL